MPPTVVHDALLSESRSVVPDPAVLRQLVAMLTRVPNVELARLVIRVPHDPCHQ